MPRALTEQEKAKQRNKLLKKGEEIILSHGIKRPSVDDIAKAAGMTKGTFYQHFESKEQFMYAVIMEWHQKVFEQAEIMLKGVENPYEAFRDFLTNLFTMPEMIASTKYYSEIKELMEAMSDKEEHSHEEVEEGMYKHLLLIIGVDIEKVKPGIVHNYVHMLYSMKGNGLMTQEDLQGTFDLMLDNLINYISGGI